VVAADAVRGLGTRQHSKCGIPSTATLTWPRVTRAQPARDEPAQPPEHSHQREAGRKAAELEVSRAMEIHHSAARGFDRAADTYERGRPGYPGEAATWLVGVLGIGPSSKVVDLAAGTGKLTRQLVPTGAELTAVEPVAGMRARLAEALPGVRVEVGTAEAMPLPDGTASAVVVGQGFHWFDGARALAEIHRVLRHRGGLGLIWNVRDESVPWVAELTRIIEPYRGDAPRYLSGRWRDPFATTALFEPLRQRSFRHTHEGDRAMVRDRIASVSFVASLSEDARAGVLAQVDDLLDNHPALRGQAAVTMPYRTDVYWTTRVP
jgi:ubiquinone/menaquinone biosynthesis C-methylase UbiE